MIPTIAVEGNQTMARNLVICCDGTNNQFGSQNTNVVRLVQALNRNPTIQRLYYDPGLGTLPEPGAMTRLTKAVSTWLGLAFGAGLNWKVSEAYTYLMDSWEPGDQVFLFGFSRGAYTVRVLAGLLHTLGLLPRGNHNLVPYVMRLFKSIRGRTEGDRSAYWDLCDEFRYTFARPVPGSEDRRFRVRFLGVWDTVSSVGWVWNPARFPFTVHNPSIDSIRHAVSIDERRCFFRQNLMRPVGGQDFQERWFAGVHADVGGGYAEADGGLWRMAFCWILEEAEKAGLRVDPKRLQAVLNRIPADATPWNDPKHESLTPAWWAAEFFPKLPLREGSVLRLPRFGLFHSRTIPDGAVLHQSLVRRIREISYAPPNLPPSFIDEIRRPGGPDEMIYQSS
jgi:uncharacterized protein (DUF2235 family)